MRPTRMAKRYLGPALTAAATATMLPVIGGCSSSGSQAVTPAAATQPAVTQSSTMSAAPQQFTSKPYAFAVTLPQDWSETDAIIDWDGKSLYGPGQPAFANIADPTLGRTLMVASAPVPAGTKLADWQAAMIRGTPPVCPQPSTGHTTTIGGEPGLAWTVKCTDGFDVNKLAVLHGQRGYIVYLVSKTANDDAEDQRIFDGIRQSFQFTG